MCNIKGQQPHLVKGENALILHHFKMRTEFLSDIKHTGI
jgi:hypothetical protein